MTVSLILNDECGGYDDCDRSFQLSWCDCINTMIVIAIMMQTMTAVLVMISIIIGRIMTLVVSNNFNKNVLVD